MGKYRKKPVVIDAMQWTGDDSCLQGTVFAEGFHAGVVQRIDKALPIKTLEGEMLCNVGDWIIKGIKGELYPCKPDIFEATYEVVSVDLLQEKIAAGEVAHHEQIDTMEHR